MMQVLASYERAVAPIIEYITLQQREADALQTPTTELQHSVFSSPIKISGEETKFQLCMCNYHQVKSSYYGRCNIIHLHLLLKEKK